MPDPGQASGCSLLFVCSIQRWGQVDLISKHLTILAEMAKNLYRTTYWVLMAVRKKIQKTMKVIMTVFRILESGIPI
jgi:hypothetical protein